jgi:hypothetical protein
MKQRTHSMCGFKSVVSAARLCRVSEEVRQIFRARSQRNEAVSLVWQRALYLGRLRVLTSTCALAEETSSGGIFSCTAMLA